MHVSAVSDHGLCLFRRGEVDVLAVVRRLPPVKKSFLIKGSHRERNLRFRNPSDAGDFRRRITERIVREEEKNVAFRGSKGNAGEDFLAIERVVVLDGDDVVPEVVEDHGTVLLSFLYFYYSSK